MAGYASIAQRKNQLIRKALNGSAFIAPYTTSAPITTLTTGTAGTSGTLSAASVVGATSVSSSVSFPAGTSITLDTAGNAETVITAGAPTGTGPFTVPVPPLAFAHASGATVTTPATINLAPLPTGYQDAGYMTIAGIALSEAITTSQTSSWGAVEDTRADITKEQTTAQLVLQETKALTIGLYTGADMSNVQGNVVTGEVGVSVPLTPSNRYYRLLSLAVDSNNAGEIYVARFLPRVSVTSKGNQNIAIADDGIPWEVTFTAYSDAALGYSQRYIFGGPGWNAILADAGFSKATS